MYISAIRIGCRVAGAVYIRVMTPMANDPTCAKASFFSTCGGGDCMDSLSSGFATLRTDIEFCIFNGFSRD